MPRSIWKGLLTFGLVNIPVELHTAVRDHSPRFRLLHRKDLAPISLERVCQKDGHAVAWQDLVKGYEIEPGRFVAVTEDDFKTAAVERSRSIDILEFVPTRDIDPRFWDTPYALAPGKGAEHSYALLVRALGDSGRSGIAKYVMRRRQHLAAVQVVDGRLMLVTMRFQEDLVALPETAAPAKLAAREISLATQLVEGLAATWDPSRYADDYVPALMKVIAAKAKGAKPRPAKAQSRPSTNVTDLMERLRESVAATRAGSGAKRTATRTSRRKPAA